MPVGVLGQFRYDVHGDWINATNLHKTPLQLPQSL